ncbi:MAG: ComF family protein [Deltaproteobacteria bacterium]|jgi:ComF family protein|nr:ComF family protein [Deltaproteobacteria bacterium]MBT4090216.1 ComF family protein [Deltaproteobacteria bacterium]MBT4265798.1 ComF family protein [Deltaproteobacteria bacterium]MBT4638347.1 ComF family protein [Deltaproteobacteria bacterium]MBT6504207.1 ComF family protein [Deltaproteobacteria bacterium]
MVELLPAWCFNCRRFISRPCRSPSQYLCSTCYGKLPFIDGPTCTHCGLEHGSGSCSNSWAKDIESFHGIFYYQDPIHAWIVNLKYSAGLFAGRILRGFVNTWFTENTAAIRSLDAVLPVPIHPLRLRQRGFNQTALLLKSQRVLPLKTGLLKKQRFTSQQAGLTGLQRRDNIKGSFKATPSLHSKNVLLFDDVCTTGQTLGEICSCLKKVGVGQIHILTLSRSM